jgi:single-stranded-DNA-specific exonuclease
MTQTIQGHKFLWKIPECDAQSVCNISRNNNLSHPVAHVLYTRGYITDESINNFLFSTYDNNIFPPELLKGANEAVTRIIQAINNKEKILIFGDYDVDGITSSSILLSALIPLGANINFYLPIRETEGYGLSVSAIERAHKNNYTLIITVDNGITAHPAAQRAKDLGIDLIITDHHHPPEKLPQACAIVDPCQDDCPYPFKFLAGVGVTFKIISLLYKKFNIQKIPDKIYELLMLGTIADVVPLINENRFWVRYGLSLVNKTQSVSFKTLINNSRLNKNSFDARDIGFIIAPQINALGRLSNPRDAVKFLIDPDPEIVFKIGKTLYQINETRKKIENQVYNDIEIEIKNNKINLELDKIIIAGSSGWPAGVIGLVAGKLTQNYGRPTILFHLENNIARGSCRSIPEFHIFHALESCKDLLISFGGHSCAAGLKLTQKNIPLLKERLEILLCEKILPSELVPKINIDATITLPDLNKKIITDLELLEPFGNQNPQPLFLISNTTLLSTPTLLKDKHVKCNIFSDGIIKPVIFFNRPELYPVLKSLGDKPFNLAAHVIKNEWEGTLRIELQGIDISIF